MHQEDLFLSDITVREHLLFTAALKMAKQLSWAEREKRVDEVPFKY